jgi:hypothetical protein
MFRLIMRRDVADTPVRRMLKVVLQRGRVGCVVAVKRVCLAMWAKGVEVLLRGYRE